ncbi:ZIP family metal transporter [Pseudorhodoferax sp.]|uniref:ZIP family metal transporter n=1 Tax=Pseudorhodoferax sp. TaxID=1993553 RepID=UPI0039E4326C
MDLLGILIATLAAGVGSVWLAALLLRLALRQRRLVADRRYLLSFAAGALLATAFVHLLPEAFFAGTDPAVLFGVLLAGLVVFFLLDKVQLWHHGHEHAHEHDHGHGDHGHRHHDGHHHHGQGGGWAVLAGDSVHCFGDGIVIASAFTASPALGVVAALAVLTHEVPHHIGDLVVLDAGAGAPRAAVLKLTLAGMATVLGGLAGWWLLDRLQEWLPYFLVVAGSSFVYVALADLIPQLQTRLTKRQTVAQVSWLAAGIALVGAVGIVAHHGHDHGHGHHDPVHAHGHEAHDHDEHEHVPAEAPAVQ